MNSFATETKIDAPVNQVWDALADIGNIYAWNPGVVASRTTSAASADLGATRTCDLGGKNFLDEEVVAWQPNEQLFMQITNTNLPFATAVIRFYLKPENDSTIVTVSPQYQLKYGFVGSLLDRVYVRENYRRGMDSLLAGLKEFVEHGKTAVAKVTDSYELIA